MFAKKSIRQLLSKKTLATAGLSVFFMIQGSGLSFAASTPSAQAPKSAEASAEKKERQNLARVYEKMASCVRNTAKTMDECQAQMSQQCAQYGLTSCPSGSMGGTAAQPAAPEAPSAGSGGNSGSGTGSGGSY